MFRAGIKIANMAVRDGLPDNTVKPLYSGHQQPQNSVRCREDKGTERANQRSGQ